MKDFLASVLVKFISWIIIGIGAIISVSVAVGAFKSDYDQTRKRVDSVEKRMDAVDQKIERIYINVEVIRSRLDRSYEPHIKEDE